MMRSRGLSVATLTRAKILNGRDGALNAAQRDDLARNTPVHDPTWRPTLGPDANTD